MKYSLIIITVITIGALSFWYLESRSFPLPSGETTTIIDKKGQDDSTQTSKEFAINNTLTQVMQTQRQILVTDGVKHTIPLNEILSGGPGKDGIPAINNPKFIYTKEATFLDDNDPGLGLSLNGESCFYPYRILVWHEIVNDTIAGEPVLVTYCPLCATGIVFERKVNMARRRSLGSQGDYGSQIF